MRKGFGRNSNAIPFIHKANITKKPFPLRNKIRENKMNAIKLIESSHREFEPIKVNILEIFNQISKLFYF